MHIGIGLLMLAMLVLPASAQQLEPTDQRWTPQIKQTPNQGLVNEIMDKRIKELEEKLKKLEQEKAK